ncbi:LCP family protein [Streptomyces sp. GC420]|uniref:LCP family protein n=1 Tax=Streptomyces sp. GC420 TaxID=2697568 RepID=UPI001414D630|nr:LCP family protein [Streptomyces sp. GC420]NBM18209.1 LytR family transcriptional regulator [Streptomyces sp. GC420]
MNTQGRGRDDIDPADQWVLNPATGDYELRPIPSGAHHQARSRAAAAPSAPDTPGAGTGSGSGRRASGTRRPEVPPQRRRTVSGSSPERQGPAGRRKRRPERSKKSKALMWTGGVLAFVVVGGSVGAYAVYKHFTGNIRTIPDDGAGTGGFSKDRAVNVLLIGTDKRTGAGNDGYGDRNSPGHADTTILLHVSKDRTNATAMSIPRDLITDIPDCPTAQEDGSTKVIPGTPGKRFNNSLGQYGRTPSCTMRTVTELTGIKIDHFMVADFNAVKTLTTAVGGVKVCLAKDIDDPDSKLKLSEGEHTIQGEQALAFVRTRKSFGNSGDLDRIKTQQQFLSSLMRRMKSDDTLTDPKKMWNLAEAATEALTVDSTLKDIGKLRDLAMELNKVDTKNISFATIPVLDNPAEVVKATVVLDETRAPQLFSMVKDDVSLTEVKKKQDAAKKDAEAARLKGPKADAADVRVKVVNGGAKAGSAQTTLAWLQNEEGVLKSENGGNAAAEVKKTRLVYGPNQADQARRLADIMGLPGSALKPASADAGEFEPMLLTLGPDFQEPGTPLTAPTKLPEGVQKVEADKQVCAK